MNKQYVIRALLPGTFVMFVACGGQDRMGSPPVPTDDPVAVNEGLTAEIDWGMAEEGRNIIEAECQRCHGAGTPEGTAVELADIDEKRERQWLIDFMTNREVDLHEDREGMRLLSGCEVRQPGRALDQNEAEQVVEYLRTL